MGFCPYGPPANPNMSWHNFFYCWSFVVDGRPALQQHCVNVSRLMVAGCRSMGPKYVGFTPDPDPWSWVSTVFVVAICGPHFQ